MILKKYRPEIDGLRAVAVVAVILYHSDLYCAGGFLGVDIFFVISGFLITSILLHELQQGSFSFIAFWERRARRLFPALFTTALVTVIFGCLTLLPWDVIEMGESAIAQSLLAINLFFLKTSGYFDVAAMEKPMMQLWSLAVEEQFYLIVPFVLFFLFRFPVLRKTGSLLALFFVGFLVSFSLFSYWIRIKPQATFYLLPTRAWELLCGCCLSVIPIRWIPANKTLRELSSFIGFALIVFAIFSTSYQPALLTCLGTASIIWANTPSAGCGHTIIGRILASYPVVFIGLISYSLYLWHWPILVYFRYWTFSSPPLGIRLALAVISFCVALVSWKYIEMPFRNKVFCPKRRQMFVFAGGGMAVVLVFGICIVALNGMPRRFPKSIELANIEYADNPANLYPFQSNEDIVSGKFVKFGAADVPVNNFVWGDSHAMPFLVALDSFCKERGIGGMSSFAPSTAPLIGYDFSRFKYSLGNRSEIWMKNVLSYIKGKHIKNVFLVGNWEAHESQQDFQRSFLNTIQALHELNTRVWVILDVPNLDRSVPHSYAKSSVLQKAPPWEWQRTTAQHRSRNQLVYRISKEMSTATFLDSASMMSVEGSDYFAVLKGNHLLYADSNHLTVYGANVVFKPLLENAVKTHQLDLGITE